MTIGNQGRKKKSILVLCILCIIGTAAPVVLAQGDSIVGVVMAVKGNLVHTYQEYGEAVKEPLEPGAYLFESSEVSSESGRGSYFQLGSSNDLVRYSRFPMTFQNESLSPMSEEKAALLLRSIGGKALRGKGAGGRASDMASEPMDWAVASLRPEDLFEWSTGLETIEKGWIDAGFALVLSEEKSTKENLSLNPLYFKLLPEVDIDQIEYTVYDPDLTIVEEGAFARQGSDWSLRFDTFSLKTTTIYDVQCLITFEDGTSGEWNFQFRVFGEREKEYIEDKAQQQIEPGSSPFMKGMTRAAMYQKYGMKLTAYQIMKDLGVSLDGLLE